MLAILNVFGPSMTGTDGAENRLLRRVAGSFFHARTMDRVVRETVEATKDLLHVLAARTKPIDRQLRPILAKMALHILGKAAFEKEGSCRQELEFAERPPPGHKLSFADTFLGIDQDLPQVALTPLPVMKHSPLAVHKRAHLLHSEMNQHLQDAIQSKRDAPPTEDSAKRSLLENLVSAGQEGVLTPAQVSGNIFIVNFAGHESNAQGVHFALLHLASQPEMQRQVQKDIDKIFGDTPLENWKYEQHYQALAESMVGAVINESLRVYTVLPILIKHTIDSPVTVTVAGRNHVVPPNTLIFINTSAAHRNPRFWPARREDIRDGEKVDASSFNPYQWLPDGKNAKFLVPPPGSFVPFSDGARGCLGQKFAMVELHFTLARILRYHSIELAIESSDADSLEAMQKMWARARTNAQKQLADGVIFNMTLRISGSVPVKLVERGKEAAHIFE